MEEETFYNDHFMFKRRLHTNSLRFELRGKSLCNVNDSILDLSECKPVTGF